MNPTRPNIRFLTFFFFLQRIKNARRIWINKTSANTVSVCIKIVYMYHVIPKKSKLTGNQKNKNYNNKIKKDTSMLMYVCMYE